MTTNYKKLICGSVLSALLLGAGVVHAGEITVTNNTDKDITLSIEGGSGRVMSDDTATAPLKSKETKKITVTKEGVGDSDTYLVTTAGVMPSGSCKSLWVTKDYDISFDAGKANMGANCTSKESGK